MPTKSKEYRILLKPLGRPKSFTRAQAREAVRQVISESRSEAGNSRQAKRRIAKK
ncbi:hypothetical protein Pan189_14340 [Stratiformator vulcanicus]|uniref:Uncharacterized protein n=1 Tax=Stratiformator vulcanicus TaxID=2527980 RepID=A0A517QZM8_9PLAN|nr:hypothetical protein Pan189_14340 [Stratiformator vulcanicus]